jgi:hypothetical protein
MASFHTFTLVTQNFNAVVAAGAGVVTQWTYTVPAGKRSVLANILCMVVDNANAVNTTIADILVNGVVVLKQFNDAAGNNTLTPVIASYPRLNLNEGDIVTGRTTNAGAAGVQMQVAAIIEENG